MRKITSFKSFLLVAVIVAAFVSASAQTSFTTIGSLRTAIDALNLPTSGATGTTTAEYTLSGEAVLTYMSTAVGTYAGVKTLYIQDATGAIMVYDKTKLITNTYALFDGITGFTGKIQNYGGMYEIVLTVNPAAATSHAHTPFTPIETTLDNLLPYIGQLVTVKNLKISDLATGGTGSFVASKNYPLSLNGTSSLVTLRTAYPELTFLGSAIPTANQDITGLVLVYTNPQLVPRTTADITPTLAAGFSSPKADFLSVSVTGSSLLVNNVANGSTVEIYSALGSKVQSAQLQSGAIQLNNLSKGMYIVRVGNLSSKIMM